MNGGQVLDKLTIMQPAANAFVLEHIANIGHLAFWKLSVCLFVSEDEMADSLDITLFLQLEGADAFLLALAFAPWMDLFIARNRACITSVFHVESMKRCFAPVTLQIGKMWNSLELRSGEEGISFLGWKGELVRVLSCNQGFSLVA